MAKATNKNNQNDIAEKLNAKYARLITIKSELKAVLLLQSNSRLTTQILQCLMT